jgi:hypothetical protein
MTDSSSGLSNVLDMVGMGLIPVSYRDIFFIAALGVKLTSVTSHECKTTDV